MNLEAIRTSLEEACGLPFALYSWEKRPPAPYGLVSLDGAGATLWTDGAHREQVLLASCDVFVRDDPSEAVASVQRALSDLPLVSWRLNTILYESDTKLTHIEWAMEFLPGVS